MRPSLFILLLPLFVYSTEVCDEADFVDTCDAGMQCEKPDTSSPDKIPKCTKPFYELQMKEASEAFESLAGAPVCKDGVFSGIRKNGLKAAEIDAFRCARKECGITPSMGSGKCLPAGECKDAIKGNDKISCEAGYELEVQHDTIKAWATASNAQCIGDGWSGSPFVPTATRDTTLVKALPFRCTKISTRDCTVAPYFDANDCDEKSTCSAPILSSDAQPKAQCAEGTLETVFDDWKDIGSGLRVECIKTQLKIVDSLNADYNFNPQMLRCKKDAVCTKDLTPLNGETSCAKDCTTIQLSASEKEIECPSDHHMEGQITVNEPYHFVEKIECFNDKMFSLKGLNRDNKVYKKLRCHKGSCDMNDFYDSNAVCDEKLICKKPDETAYTCDTDFNLQYFAVIETTQTWTPAQSISCNNKQFQLTEVGRAAPSDIAPLAFRCVKEKLCDIANYDPFTCDATIDECEQPSLDTSELKCKQDFQLQAQDAARNWIKVDSIKCDSSSPPNVLKYSTAGVESILTSARCVRKKIASLFQACAEPELDCIAAKSDQYAPMKCDDDYQLQWLDNAGNWKAAEIYANSDKFLVDSTPITPKEVRCVRMKTDTLFPANCEEDEECEKAANYAPMVCKGTHYSLQISDTSTPPVWTTVESIEANSNKFTVTLKGGAAGGTPSGIKCSRKRCTTCPQINCPTCTKQFVQGSGDTCATFGCGSNTRTIIDTGVFTEAEFTCSKKNKEGESVWSNKTAGSQITITNDVKCEKLCTLTAAKVTSSCDGVENANLCDTVPLNDDNEITCGGQLTLKSKPAQKASNLKCDKTKGEWKVTVDGGEIAVGDTETVYCMYADCDFNAFCPNCEKASNELRCPTGKIAKISPTSSEDWSTSKSDVFKCDKGKIVNKDNEEVENQRVKCEDAADPSSAASTGGSHAAIYVVVLIIVLILLVILIACVICKAKGNGWLHVIILDKIRGGDKKGKKGKKDKKSKKGSSKGGSNKGDSSIAPTDMEGQSSAEPVLPSGEKVSAEGISQTGMMSGETTGAERQEGGAISNPTPVDSMANYPPPNAYPTPNQQNVFNA